MPAQSQQQQKLFGLALAFKRGEVPSSEVSDEIKAIADRMSEKEIEDYAKTKHKGLPKMKEQLRKIVREIMREQAISELNEGDGLWANIRAKKARGEKPAHGNSQAHKDAVKAAKKINKESVTEGYGEFIKAKNLTDIVALSKKKKNAVFYVTDDNNSRIGAFYLKNGKFAKATSANPNYDLQNSKTTLRDRSDVIYKYKVDESVNESASKEAMGIAALTGTRGSAVEDFINKHELDGGKLFRSIKKANLRGRLNFVSALAGKDGNPNQKLTIKLHKKNESINEGPSTEEKRIAMLAVRKQAKYRNVSLEMAVQDQINALEDLKRDIKKGKIKK